MNWAKAPGKMALLDLLAINIQLVKDITFAKCGQSAIKGGMPVILYCMNV